MSNIVLAITGASGSVYAVRLLEVLLSAGNHVHLTISPSATQVFKQELGLQIDLDNFKLDDFLSTRWSQSVALTEETGSSSIFSESDLVRGKLTYHSYKDYSAGIASGSFQTVGMVICPCSMGTLSSIANGISTNLIHRAADVHLKERRKLVIIPRETPLGSIQLHNMKTLSDAGAVILPAMPGFYHQPVTIHDLVDFVVVRICDQLGVSTNLMKRWGADS